MAKREVEVKVKVDTTKAVQGTDKLDKGFKKVDKSASKSKKALAGVGESSTALGGGLGVATSGAGALLKSFKALIMSPIGIVLGLIAGALLAVKTAFTSSEEGQNKYNKLMSVLGALLGNLMDLLADVGEALISTFENPKAALKNIGAAIKKNLTTRLEGLMELIPQLGKAISQLFSGDFKEAMLTSSNAIAKVTLGVDNLQESLAAAEKKAKDFFEEQKKEMAQAGKVADMRAKADKIERNLLVEKSILQSKIAQLRLKARMEDTVSAKERKAALIEAQGYENTLLDKTTAYLSLRRDAQILENTFSRSNKENLDKEAKGIAAVNNQVAVRANVARQLQRELNTINGQIEAEQNLIDNKNKKESEALLKLELEKKESGLRTLESEAELKLLRAEMGLEDPNKTADEHAIALEEKMIALQNIYQAEKDLKIIQFEEDGITKEEQRAILLLAEQEHINRLTAIKNKAVDDLQTKEQAAADFKKKNEQLAAQGTIQTTQAVLGAVGSLLAEGSAEAKAIALAQATISGVQGVQAAYTSASAIPIVGTVLGPLAAVAAGVVAAKNIQKISSQKTGAKKGGGGGGGASFSAPAIAPPINPNTLFSTANNFEGQESESLGNSAGINQKVVVLESDISDAINNVNVVESDSEIG